MPACYLLVQVSLLESSPKIHRNAVFVGPFHASANHTIAQSWSQLKEKESRHPLRCGDGRLLPNFFRSAVSSIQHRCLCKNVEPVKTSGHLFCSWLEESMLRGFFLWRLLFSCIETVPESPPWRRRRWPYALHLRQVPRWTQPYRHLQPSAVGNGLGAKQPHSNHHLWASSIGPRFEPVNPP